MSEPEKTFELVLKKTYTRKSIYSDNIKNIHTLKPQDVISSVSSQIKAIQIADSIKTSKKKSKDLNKIKRSSYLSVNKLKVCDVPTIAHTKFDTQCVTDTQLINLIEDAEILDVHRGMTQEFDTSFSPLKTEKQAEILDKGNTVVLKTKNECTDKEESKECVEIMDTGQNVGDKITNTGQCDMETNHFNDGSKVININDKGHVTEQVKIDENDIFELEDAEEEEMSQILTAKTVKPKSKFKYNDLKDLDSMSVKDDKHTQESTELLNQCIEIDINDNTDRSPSPIFINKNIKTKSKPSSPLVFALDKFEHFENMTLPLLETSNFNIAKHVINSQIMEKELCLNTDEKINLIEGENIENPVLQRNIIELAKLDPTIIDPDVKVIEIDKDLSEKVLKQLTNEHSKGDKSVDVFKDDILFSSDEEENYIHKEYQDLPFTCALETSFYEQSDILDKTMYVGFQTASNKSIQVGTDSFVKAKTILNEISKDDITITELVKTCDSFIKDTSKVEKVKCENSKDFEVNLAQKADNQEYSYIKKETGFVMNESNNEMHKECNITKQPENTNYIGFITANNKKLNLSDKALARCKKIFHDIDLNEHFDTLNEKENEVEMSKDSKNTSELYCNDNMGKNGKADTKVSVDELQNIDEDIIQEFENIEMSLEDVKPEIETNSLGFKTASNKNIEITDEALNKMKDIFKDIDFDEDFNDNNNENLKAEDIALSQIIRNNKVINEVKAGTSGERNITKQDTTASKNESTHKTEQLNKLPKAADIELNFDQLSTNRNQFEGFKTANNKKITVSHDALVKSKDIFKDIDLKASVENVTAISPQPSTSKGFVGFKTANNEAIKISENAWNKTKTIFNDINSTELPKKEIKDYPNITVDNETSKNNFVGFKTANNNNICFSKEALAKTENIFDDIDLIQFGKPVYNHNIHKDIEKPKASESQIAKETVTDNAGFKSKTEIKLSNKASPQTINNFKELKQGEKYLIFELNNLETNVIGFRTANNKEIKISNNALITTKNIFKDIDSSDFKLPNINNKDYPDFADNNYTKEVNQFPVKNDSIKANFGNESNETKFQGFKTASNKKVKVSSEALIKSKNIFKDIEKNADFHFEDKTLSKKEVYPTEINNDDIKIGPSNTVFKGFQTANKKPVTVSANALERTKRIFEEFELERSNTNQTEAGFSGFQTASNKQVKISKQALAKNKTLFKDIDINDITNTDTKKLKEKSLYPEEIYQNDELLNDENKETNSLFKGFQTASKKPVAITKTALEDSKKLFQDLHEKSNHFGFQTGNNKVVEISEKTLTESKKLLDINRPESNSFRGFQTANNKTVKISEAALAKTKKTLQDIDTVTHHNQDSEVKKHEYPNFAFKSGNNNAITVSKVALAKSKRLFSELDDKFDNIIIKKDKKESSVEENIDIRAIIDTQVINNFEESLHTEDFHVTPNANKCKRSGSPILSCPRAKKRKKFETPYNTKSIPKPIIKTTESIKKENKIKYCDDYKKNKRYTLKDLAEMTKNMTATIDPYLANFNFENLLKFEFKFERNDLTESDITIELLKEQFLDSVNAKLVPNGWLDNHLKMILWKLISYEIKFKSAIVCTARNVIDQLKYRYDRELYNAQRPALRKIFEKDDVASKTMVLCVAGIYVDGVRVESVLNKHSNIELLLTDGWYCIRGSIDPMLVQLTCSNKIHVGSKIVTCGAELIGGEQAVAPWEDTSSFRLKIFGNSTRRARWDARLGYHGNGAILSPLSSVNVMGGKVSKLRVFVTRVYPALYVEKFEDGSTVTRSERLENIHQMKAEAERQAFMEKLYEEVEKEFADQESQDSEGVSDSCTEYMDSGSQIAKVMKKSKDPADFRAQLSASQSHLLEAHTSKKREHLLQDIQRKIQERVEKAGVCVNRNVVTLLKIRVAGVREKGDSVEVSKGMVSIWKPNEAIQEIIKEGDWIDVLNVVPTAVRYSEIQISAGRQSVFSTSKFKPSEKVKPYTTLLQRQCYPIKDLTQNPSLSTNYNEIDTVGLIFLIDPPNNEFDSSKQPFQNVFLTDAEKNIICVNFWGGLNKFGYQNVLDTGQLITCVNLQKRAGNTKKTIPQYRVTEFSYFTKTPKYTNSIMLLDELTKKFLSLDRRKFCLDCVVLKNNYSVIKQNNENISPYRFNNNDINISKNKVFIDSPLERPNMDDIFNLTGLDFESTFKQDTQLSTEILKRKRKVNEKIAKLKMYGEPPPLSPMHIINRSKHASSSYKSPLLLNNKNNNNTNSTPNNQKSSSDSSKLNVKSDSCKNVATVEKTPQKCKENCNINDSPVLLNRTYVKSVNPVKINFDVKENNDTIDHFAEEFDGSPPLSLD